LTLVITCTKHHIYNLYNLHHLNNGLKKKIDFHSNTTKMTSNMTEDNPLSTLYLQVEYGETLSAVLSVSTTATEAEIRDTYRALVLRIRPDKAPNDSLRKLHTLLFQKVQSFYDAIPTSQSSKPGDSAP
jgi:hypothetical protein